MAARVLFVTGKGGTGKTAVSEALGRAYAQCGARTLLVDLGGGRGLAERLRVAGMDVEPRPVSENLSAAKIESRKLVERYFHRLLRIPLLSRQLLASASFNAIVSAAPGVTPFLILDYLHSHSTGRKRFDRIVVDGTATGHALQLLRAPSQLSRIAPPGAVGSAVRAIEREMHNPNWIRVAIVSLAEEMSVSESCEAQRALDQSLRIATTRPILNRCAAGCFSTEDMDAIEECADRQPQHPWIEAGQRHVAAQRRSSTSARRLRSASGRAAVRIEDAAESGNIDWRPLQRAIARDTLE